MLPDHADLPTRIGTIAAVSALTIAYVAAIRTLSRFASEDKTNRTAARQLVTIPAAILLTIAFYVLCLPFIFFVFAIFIPSCVLAAASSVHVFKITNVALAVVIFIGMLSIYGISTVAMVVAIARGLASKNILPLFWSVLSLTMIVSVSVISLQYNAITAAFLFMVLLIPVMNGIFNFLSVTVSRILLGRVVGVIGRFSLFAHIVSDIVIAVILLVGMTICLVISCGLINRTLSYAEMDVINLAPFLIAVQQYPASQGIWVTAMLFSTLLPTLSHLLLALVAMIVMPMPGRDTILGWLRTDPHFWRRCGVVSWLLFGVALALAVLIAAGGTLWWAISLSGATAGSLLYEIAKWSASLIGQAGLPPFP